MVVAVVVLVVGGLAVGAVVVAGWVGGVVGAGGCGCGRCGCGCGANGGGGSIVAGADWWRCGGRGGGGGVGGVGVTLWAAVVVVWRTSIG